MLTVNSNLEPSLQTMVNFAHIHMFVKDVFLFLKFGERTLKSTAFNEVFASKVEVYGEKWKFLLSNSFTGSIHSSREF